MIFPNSNLPVASQPWGREVTKQLTDLILIIESNEVNNTARDNQLNSSVIAASAAATNALSAAQTAQEAIDGLLGLGDTGSGYTINADNLTAGTITGLTVQTATSGARIVLDGVANSIYFYDQLNGTSGYIRVTGTDREGKLVINGPSAESMELASGEAAMYGGGSELHINNQGIQTLGNLDVNGTLRVVNPGTATSTTANTRLTTDAPTGRVLFTAASTQKIKNTITPIFDSQEVSPHKLLNLPVVAFKYNDGYLNAEDPRVNKLIPGFIAEQVFEHYSIAADIGDGGPENWNERIILPGVLALVQELYSKVTELEGRLNG